MTSTILPYFWDLASIEETKRVKACEGLMEQLMILQNKYEKELGSTVLNNERKLVLELRMKNDEQRMAGFDHLEKLFCQDMVYTIKRLIRGLPSSREAARLGFSLALTELLTLVDFLSVDYIIYWLEQSTQVSKAMKGQEERDMYFGLVFGILCLIKSGTLERPLVADENNLKVIMKKLLDIADKKSYIKEICFETLIDLIPIAERRSWIEIYIQTIKPMYEANGEQYSPESLAIAIHLQSKWPKLVGHCFAGWNETEILHPSNITKLSGILKGSIHSNPRLNIVWKYVLAGIPNSLSLSEFWTKIVDELLFTSTHERKYLGFLLFEQLITNLKDQNASCLFTINFMRCFINNLSGEDNRLYKIAHHILNSLLAIADTNSEIRYLLVLQFIGKYGNIQFDQITKTKTVERLVAGFNPSQIRSYVDYLIELIYEINGFNHMETDAPLLDSHINSRRQRAIDQLYAIIKTPTIRKEKDWVMCIMKFLMVNGFFIFKQEDMASRKTKNGSRTENEMIFRVGLPPLSNHTRGICQKRFYAALNELDSCNQITTSTMEGVARNSEFWTCELALLLNQYRLLPSLELRTPFDEETLKSVEACLETINDIQKSLTMIESKPKAKRARDVENVRQKVLQLRAFELLYIHVGFQMYLSSNEALSVLKDLNRCFEEVNREKKTRRTVKRHPHSKEHEHRSEDEDEEPEPIAVLTDILLSFLARPSALLRSVSEQVFKVFAGQMTKNSLNLLFDIILTRVNLYGQKELFDTEEDNIDMVEVDMDEEYNSDQSDHISNDCLEGDDTTDSDELSDFDMENKADEEVDEEFRQKVKEVLSFGNGVTSEDEEIVEDEDILDDNQMTQFDEKLSEIFRHRKMEQLEKKDAKRNVQHFKLRVLDMLEIFIRKQSANPLILELILPLCRSLLQAIANAQSKEFVSKLINLFKNRLIKMKDLPSLEKSDIEKVHQINEEIVNLAMHSPSAQISGIYGSICALLSKILFSIGKKNSDCGVMDKARYLSAVRTLLSNFMTKKHTKTHATFFLELVNRSPKVGWFLIDDFIQFAHPNATCKEYLHIQTFNLLSSLIQRISIEDCHIHDFKTHFSAIIFATIETLVAFNESKGKSKHMKEILKFLLLLLHKIQTVFSLSELEKCFDRTKFLASLSSLQSNDKSQSQTLKALSQRIIKQFNLI